jgi:hypothetical protein
MEQNRESLHRRSLSLKTGWAVRLAGGAKTHHPIPNMRRTPVSKKHAPKKPAPARGKATLSAKERAELARCEQIIEQGRTQFVKVGEALQKIRNRKLYRENNPNFDAYLKNRWGFGRIYALNQIDSSEVVNNLVKKKLPAPTDEATARAIGRLSKRDQPKVWKKALKRAGNNEPSSGDVRQAAIDLGLVKAAQEPPEPREPMSDETSWDRFVAAADDVIISSDLGIKELEARLIATILDLVGSVQDFDPGR